MSTDLELTVDAGMTASPRFELDEGQTAVVAFIDNIARARVIKLGSPAVYATFDGSTPTMDGPHTYELPAGRDYVVEQDTTNTDDGDVVSLIAGGPVSIRVERA